MKLIQEIEGAVKVMMFLDPLTTEGIITEVIWQVYNGDMDKRQLAHIVWLQYMGE